MMAESYIVHEENEPAEKETKIMTITCIYSQANFYRKPYAFGHGLNFQLFYNGSQRRQTEKMVEMAVRDFKKSVLL